MIEGLREEREVTTRVRTAIVAAQQEEDDDAAEGEEPVARAG